MNKIKFSSLVMVVALIMALAGTALVIGGCGSSSSGGGGVSAPGTLAPGTTPATPTGVVSGIVRDAAGTAVAGVTITAVSATGAAADVARARDTESVTTTSAADGSYSMDVPETERCLITFVKNGYVLACLIVRVRSDQPVSLSPNITAIGTTAAIDAVTGGTVTTADGATLVLAANSLVDAAGEVFSGVANVAMTAFDPSTTAGRNAFPGEFEGIDTSGSTVPFLSYGFMDATVQDGDGNQLQLGDGNTAGIKIPIPAGLQGAAPASMPLWYFNTTDGRWYQVGTGTKDGNFYQANISHFSFWNFDYPYDRAYVKGRVVDCDGNPVAGAQVIVKGVSTNTWFNAERSTAEDGVFPATDGSNYDNFPGIPIEAGATCEIWASKQGVTGQRAEFIAPAAGETLDFGDLEYGDCDVTVPASAQPYPTGVFTHLDGFDFSEGTGGTDNKDGNVVMWAPWPNNAWVGDGTWWNPFTNTATENFTKDMGEVELNSVLTVPGTWDGGAGQDLPPFQVGHVYVVKCLDGYAKFKVLTAEAGVIEAQYWYTSGTTFSR